MEIYLQQNGQQVGPYSEEQLRNSVSEGTINQFDLARHDGMTDWQPLCTVINIGISPPSTTQLPPPPATTSGTPHLQPPPAGTSETPQLPPLPGARHLPPPSISLPPPDIVSTKAPRNALVPSALQKLGELGVIISGWACFIIGLYVLIMFSWPFYIHYALFVAAVLLSIEALSQHKVVAGLSLLMVTLLLPTFVGFGLLFYRASKAAEPHSDESGKIQSEQKVGNLKNQ